jgi:hypothetical protein
VLGQNLLDLFHRAATDASHATAQECPILRAVGDQRAARSTPSAI